MTQKLRSKNGGLPWGWKTLQWRSSLPYFPFKWKLMNERTTVASIEGSFTTKFKGSFGSKLFFYNQIEPKPIEYNYQIEGSSHHLIRIANENIRKEDYESAEKWGELTHEFGRFLSPATIKASNGRTYSIVHNRIDKTGREYQLTDQSDSKNVRLIGITSHFNPQKRISGTFELLEYEPSDPDPLLFALLCFAFAYESSRTNSEGRRRHYGV
jgi:hypothetical protein